MPLEQKEITGSEDDPEDFYEYETPPNDPQRNNLNLGRSQKIAAMILAVFAFGVVIAWGMQVKSNINTPFAYVPADKTAEAGSQTEDAGGLRTKDTDGDGLSDYDELNMYRTSPYLEDSDSDGYRDKQEIESDNDPGCPVGRECQDELLGTGSGFSQASENGTSTTSKTSAQTPVGDGVNPNKIFDENKFNNTSSPSNIDNDETLKGFVSGSLDAKSLRAVLVESGFDGNALSKISDEELMNIYRDTYNAN